MLKRPSGEPWPGKIMAAAELWVRLWRVCRKVPITCCKTCPHLPARNIELEVQQQNYFSPDARHRRPQPLLSAATMSFRGDSRGRGGFRGGDRGRGSFGGRGG